MFSSLSLSLYLPHVLPGLPFSLLFPYIPQSSSEVAQHLSSFCSSRTHQPVEIMSLFCYPRLRWVARVRQPAPPSNRNQALRFLFLIHFAGHIKPPFYHILPSVTPYRPPVASSNVSGAFLHCGRRSVPLGERHRRAEKCS